MTLLIEDFVNREEQLATLWKMIRQEVDQRVLLICGPDGMGKTYLLDEFRAECEAKGINCACIEFVEGSDQSYMTIVLNVYKQLGPEGFEHLIQTITETRTLGAWETVVTPPVAARVGYPAANPVQHGTRSDGNDFAQQAIHGAKVEGDKIVGHVGDVGPGAQVIIGKQIEATQYYVTQIIQRDDPWVQQMIQADITAAFRDCLIELTTTRTVAFLLDSWERATTDTRHWLRDNLLKWTLDKKLPNALAVVAGTEVPDLGRPMRRIRRLTLAGLPDEAVRTYWIEKCGLPLEDVSYVIKLSNREPYLMALMADRQLVS